MLRKILAMLTLMGIFQGMAAAKQDPRAPSRSGLDTALVRKTYLDGEFDMAVDHLEEALKYGGPFSHSDSVFLFKHLGVMYAAKYETREKGKHFMLQLLHVEPTAKILDMYASDMIYMIFKNIQDEFEASRPGRAKDPVRPQPVGSDPPKKARRLGWIGWTAGTVAAVGGIALTLHLLDEERPENRVRTSRE